MVKVFREFVVFTACGDALHLPEEDAMKIQLFKCVMEKSRGETRWMKVACTRHVIQLYLFWQSINDVIDILDWADIINLLTFAAYAGCYDFTKYFARNILPQILKESNTCYVRYLLSIRQNPDYIKNAEMHKDECHDSWECEELKQMDEKEDHSDDNLLKFVPFEELIWLFPRLSYSSRERLARIFPPTHSYGERLRKMIVEYRLVMYKGANHLRYCPFLKNRGIMIPRRPHLSSFLYLN